MHGSNLVGNRVELRALSSADEAMAAAWRERDGTWATLGYAPGSKNRDFTVIARAGGSMIGVAGLYRICAEDRTASLGMLIVEAAADQGCLLEVSMGLAQVAFERLQLNRVELVVTELEQRDLYACWGAGFEFEGRSKQAVYRDGAFRDVLRYGLLRKRWEGLRHARMPQPVSV